MVRARRAKRNPARAVVPAVAVAAVLVAAVIWWRPWTGQAPSAVPSANDTTAVETPGAPATSAQPSPTESASSSPSPDGSSSTGSSAVAVALRECRATVTNGDDLVIAARQGLSHWATHVKAQADADDKKISSEELGAIFARTRVAGNDQDTPLWAKATKAWDADENSDDPDGACVAPDSASTEQTAVFERCQARAKGLPAAIEAGDNGMADWMTHLKHMKASRDHYVHNAQDIWIDDYENATPNLDAWKKANAKFAKLPTCA